MGFFDIFKNKAQSKGNKQDLSYSHPTLGSMAYEYDNWFIDNVKIPLFDTDIYISLEGSDTGPSDDSLKGYEFISENWDEIILNYGIIDAFYEMHEAYADGMDIDLIDKENFADSIIPQSLSITSADTLSFSVQFTWQDENDDHIITAEVENGSCTGCPVDG